MIVPGSHIGILGGGPLARMTALAGRRMGYRFSILDPMGQAAPAAPVAERVMQAPYTDKAAVVELARGLDVATIEFENIPVGALRTLEHLCPVRPRWGVLEVCQHREREKTFLHRVGYPHAPFRVVANLYELTAAVAALGTPCVLKTAESGYDGKGQWKIEAGANLVEGWRKWSGGQVRRGVVEGWVPFTAELSVVCARNARGQSAAFPVFENIHEDHILNTTVAPGRFSPRVLTQARDLALSITNVRAVCDLPLGATELLAPAVMVNLLGNLWSADGRAPDWEPILSEPNAKLHLYGKGSAKPGRKMGHFCVVAPTVKEALAKAGEIRERLRPAG